jgi:hemoglobin
MPNLGLQTFHKGISTMKRLILSTALAATVFASISFAQTPAPAKSLYERLGGQPAIQAVASGLVDRILADTRVNKWFAHAASSPENTKLYKEKLAAFICRSTGGPCTYTGQDMVTAHKGRGVTNEAFNAVAEDLSGLLDQLKVPAKEKAEVMTLVGSLRPSIVQAAGN